MADSIELLLCCCVFGLTNEEMAFPLLAAFDLEELVEFEDAGRNYYK
jgi:hypothetical protein